MAKTTSQTINELSTVFLNIKPDIVFVIADRYENLAVAISASYMNIPVAHVQGGEVTGSIDESVRHAITKLSHIHTTQMLPLRDGNQTSTWVLQQAKHSKWERMMFYLGTH